MKLHSKVLIVFHFCFAFVLQTNAQQQLQHEKGEYVDSLHRYYQQASLPVYIYISTKPKSSNPTELRQNNSQNKENTVAPMYLDGPGKHHLQHFDTHDNKPVSFDVYADGYSPITTSQFLQAPTYSAKNVIYYGRGLSVPLAATDDMSGVNQIYYSVNQQNYTPYSQAIPFQAEGETNLKYYSVDKVGNAEKPIEKKITIDITNPITYHHITGISDRNVISLATVIFLEPTDNIAGISKTYYRFDSETDKLFDGIKVKFDHLREGDHVLYYYSIDNVANKETEKKFEFFLDKTAPIVATDILGDRFVVDDKIYFSGRTKLKITAVDNKSGLKSVMYSVDATEFQTYKDPFYLPNRSGVHIIRYFALDSLGNQSAGGQRYEEYRHNVSKVYVDLVGPTLHYKFTGKQFVTRDTVFINSQTKIEFSFHDSESGAQKIMYCLDTNPQEILYSNPFSIEQEGFHKLDLVGYDNVNNRNVKPFFFIVDNQEPTIFTNYSVMPIGKKEGFDIYPPYLTVFAAASDDLTGVEKIYYILNSDPEKECLNFISNFKKGQINTVKIRAFDRLGNESKKEIKFIINEK